MVSALSAYKYRFFMATLITAYCLWFFLSESRLPNLGDKALMGGAIELQDPLSFESKYQLDPNWSLPWTLWITTVNWIFTNRRGMMFGVVFGALLLTMLRYLPKRGFKNGFANSAVGLLIGAPLGVCVNCASPVAAGLFSGGSRAETTLAAMVSSPTFNVVVLSMAFAMLPFSLAISKVFLTVFLVLIVIPLLCRALPKESLQIPDDELQVCAIPALSAEGKREGPLAAVLGFGRDFVTDFWNISRMTVPMMIVAGFLGTVVATLLPFEMFAEWEVGLLSLTVAAVIGVFAPVPMSFDVVLSAALAAAGVPLGLVFTLFFTLGAYSIYSHIVVSQTISKRAANYMAGSIVILGILGGFAYDQYDRWQVNRAIEDLTKQSWNFGIIGSAHAEEVVPGILPQNISIARTPFTEKSPAGEKLFTREEAWHRGVDRVNGYGMESMFTPFMFSPGSLGAADFDGDGDTDLVMTSLDGPDQIMFFNNDGTGHFKKSVAVFSRFTGKDVFNAMPMDVDNDGWTDLVISAHLAGTWIFNNVKGKFSERNSYQVANNEQANLSLVLAAGDLNKDGFLDLVLGNHEGTRMGYFPTDRDINRVVFNVGGRLDGSSFKEHGGVPGDTLSILMSDINGDGNLDVIEANDFNQPESVFIGDGKGELKLVRKSDGLIPVTTHTTMSVKATDFNNDGKSELLFSQIAGRADNMSDRLLTRSWSMSCTDLEREEDRINCQRNIDIREWYKIGGFTLDTGNAGECESLDAERMGGCKAMILRDLAVRSRNQDLCRAIDAKYRRVIYHCNAMFELKREPKPLVYEDEIPQTKGRNVFLAPNDSGGFDDVTSKAGLEIGGWSWDVKTFAFDNTELQDVMILNGFWGLQNVSPSKLYYKNLGGNKFANATKESGVEDYSIMASGAASDYDNDGDIDLVSSTINGPLIDFWNNSQQRNSIIVDFRDMAGNRYGVGNRVTIKYGPDGKLLQTREMQLSGGFMVYDELSSHFGLGEYDTVAEMEIVWSTGEKSVLPGPFKAGNRYTVTRTQLQVN